MERRDFYKGQIVWIYLIGNAARGCKTLEECIQAWEVVAVGRKYVTVKKRDGSWEVKFDFTNNCRQACTYGVPDYVLYLHKEDILQEIHRSQLIKNIRQTFRWENRTADKMALKDLETIDAILQKYKSEE